MPSMSTQHSVCCSCPLAPRLSPSRSLPRDQCPVSTPFHSSKLHLQYSAAPHNSKPSLHSSLSLSLSYLLSSLLSSTSPLSFILPTTSLPSLTHTMSTNSNDAKRDAEEGTNRLKEEANHAYNSVKRAVVGGSETTDTAQETAFHAQNKASETGNRIGDKVSEIATNIMHPSSSTTSK